MCVLLIGLRCCKAFSFDPDRSIWVLRSQLPVLAHSVHKHRTSIIYVLLNRTHLCVISAPGDNVIYSCEGGSKKNNTRMNGVQNSHFVCFFVVCTFDVVICAYSLYKLAAS